MPQLRNMTPADIPFGLELCRLAGWNQLEDDWRRLLALAPHGLFVAEEEGRLCGTASAVAYGRQTAWIGMVLVHPDFRKRGLGSALMTQCLDYLKSCQVESIKLDATDQGRPVYLKLGFKDERPICRYSGPRPANLQGLGPARRPIDGEWPTVETIDRRVFGADRSALLTLLRQDGISAVVAKAEAGEFGAVQAYGLARAGFNASHLGPVVAGSAALARPVIESLLLGLPDGPVYWDILPDNQPARELAEGLGFTEVRRLTRMYLGEKMNPGEVERTYAVAGFELG